MLIYIQKWIKSIKSIINSEIALVYNDQKQIIVLTLLPYNEAFAVWENGLYSTSHSHSSWNHEN